MNEGNGNLEVYRESFQFAKLRRYSVCVDGMKVGSVKDGSTLTLSLPEGVHEVWCKIDWTKSNKKEILIESGKTAKVTVGYEKKYNWKYFALMGLYLVLLLLGATLGMPILIGFGAAGLVITRVGNLHLFQK